MTRTAPAPAPAPPPVVQRTTVPMWTRRSNQSLVTETATHVFGQLHAAVHSLVELGLKGGKGGSDDRMVSPRLKFGGPAQRVVYAGPDQSLRRSGEAANGLPEPYRQKSGGRTSQYCDMPRSTSAWVRGPHTGTTEGLILLADHLPPNGYSPPYAQGPSCRPC